MILQNYQNFTEMYHLLWTTNRNLEYCISANSFRGNYSFLKLTLCTVTFDHSTYSCGNYSRAETIHGNMVVQIVNWRIRIHTICGTAERPQYFSTISNKNDHCGPPWIVELMEPILTPFFWPHWGVKIVGTCCQKEIRLQPGQSIMYENKWVWPFSFTI